MTELTGMVGFGSPTTERTSARRRRIGGIELIATLALAASLIVSATAVSIGMARAQVLPSLGGHFMPSSVASFLSAAMAGKIH
jgi:hypothetical protein